jgi:hypothetical protein
MDVCFSKSSRGQWKSFGGLISFQSAGKISDFSNADVAVDQYHRFQVSSSLQNWHVRNICMPHYFYDHPQYDLCDVLGLVFSGGCMYSSWQTWEWMLTGF